MSRRYQSGIFELPLLKAMAMIKAIKIEPGEMARRRAPMRSRWAQLVNLLQRASADDGFEQPLAPEENDGPGRRRARQGIYAIAAYHGIPVSLASLESAILVTRTKRKKTASR
jgi:hypothetical protein